MRWALLLAGGGIGTLLRFSLSLFVDSRLGVRFPWGTLAVNVLGCFAIGVVVTLADTRGTFGPGARLFLVSGVLGGFTTFSSFGMETWQLVESGHAAAALLNAAGSVVAGLAAVAAGVWLTRAIT